MRKTRNRIRLARLFAKYKRLGLDDARLSVFDACARIRGSQKTLSDANDIFAAWACARLLRDRGRAEDIELFCDVYLYRSHKAGALAIKHHYDERTVYRRLSFVERQYEIMRKSIETKK